jgi:hypothetical protein
MRWTAFICGQINIGDALWIAPIQPFGLANPSLADVFADYRCYWLTALVAFMYSPGWRIGASRPNSMPASDLENRVSLQYGQGIGTPKLMYRSPSVWF